MDEIAVEKTIRITALQKGREEGRKEGRKEGLQEGAQKVKKHIALEMLIKGIDVNTIAAITELTPEAIRLLGKNHGPA